MNKVHFFLSNIYAFIFVALIALEDLQKMSNESGWSEHDYFVIDIHRKAFRFSSLSIMLAVSFREFVHIIYVAKLPA